MQFKHMSIGPNGNLFFDGADLELVAREFGTPAYVMSERAIRENARSFMQPMKARFGGNFKVAYASKALCAGFLYPILRSEGLHADVVSGGELFTALKAGFPAEMLHFHGNNKTESELDFAVKSGIGSVIIDNESEIDMLDAVAARHGVKVKTLFRVKPGIEAHTHEAVQTGHTDCKFGFGIGDGEAMRIAGLIHGASNLDFHGIHCHIGSQIFSDEAYDAAAERMIKLMADIEKALNCKLPELILGGGFGVKYTENDTPIARDRIINGMADAVFKYCERYSLSVPEIVIEPGRSIVGDAGATLYTVGGVKDIKDARCYVSVNGGMTDNPRYALYKSEYSACVVTRAGEPLDTVQTIAGRCCESGDIVTRDAKFQRAKPGDLLCVFTTGAYNFSMANNYNRVPRAPIVLVCEDGTSKVVVRRESYEDLVRNDIM